MRNLLILGAGEYGLFVSEIARATGRFDKIDFLDDQNPQALGKFSDCALYTEKYAHTVVAIGDAELRLAWLKRLTELGFKTDALVHPRAYVAPSAVIGDGSIVEPMAVIQGNATIGKGCLITSGAVVKHNATVGSGCYIDANAVVMPGAVVANGVRISCNQEVGK